MDWNPLETEEQLAEIDQRSATRPQLVFKHSTRCAISSVIKNRLYKAGLPEGIDFYYLDLIKFRAVSNKLAELYNVPHESPQVLLIKEGTCVYNESHSAIYMEDIVEEADKD